MILRRVTSLLVITILALNSFSNAKKSLEERFNMLEADLDEAKSDIEKLKVEVKDKNAENKKLKKEFNEANSEIKRLLGIGRWGKAEIEVRNFGANYLDRINQK